MKLVRILKAKGLRYAPDHRWYAHNQIVSMRDKEAKALAAQKKVKVLPNQ